MRFSIVIAAHNEGEALWRTVRSCVETCGGSGGGTSDYEIVIADDASWDGSVEEVERRFPRVRTLRNPERLGPSPTKDRGARAASGEVLVFLDGHAKPEPGALPRLVDDVQRLGGRAVATPTIVWLDVARWRNAASPAGHGYRADLEDFRGAWLPLSGLRVVREGPRTFYESPAAIGCALAVSRELYETLWGFDPDMRSWGVEDVDFGLKCWLMGFPILHDPEAVVGHRFQSSFDNYEVPREELLANRLRLARKNFTPGVWGAWVERARERNEGPLPGRPEGLWAAAWQLFESRRASAEQERAYLLARRERDEFWYAQRFGLDWPKLAGAGGAGDAWGTPLAARSAATSAAQEEPFDPSEGPSPGPPTPEPKPRPACEDDAECCPDDSSPFPVRYFDGEVQIAATDLSAGGFGETWRHRRVYSNQLSADADFGNGWNWLVEQWPYLAERPDGSIAVVRGTRKSLWFDLVGGGYVGRYGAKSTLERDAGSGQFVLTLPGGDRWRFHDFDQFQKPPGLFASQVSKGGQVTEVTSYTDDERIEEIQRSAAADGETVTQSFRYAYNPEGRTTAVTLRQRVGTAAWTNVRRALYEYYGPDENFGSAGDLRRVRSQEPQNGGWADAGTDYYRYYQAGDADGFEHGLKYVVGPRAYDLMTAAGLDPLTAANGLIAQYADYAFQYDSDRRATRETVDGGSRVFTFAYTTSGHPDGDNSWTRKTVETRPDGSEVAVYTNHIGQFLVRELRSGARRWVAYRRYDAAGREILRAEPSAVTGYDDSAADLNVSLKADDGLIRVTDYYGDGGAEGYVHARKIKRGDAGGEIMLETLEYAAHTAGGVTVRPVSKRTVYREEDGSGALETAFSYVWHAGTVRMQERTVTLPAVPPSQNGDGTSAVRRERFDLHGRPTWTMDERGFLALRSYDVLTGAVVRSIQDVDASLVAGVPAGWATPAGGGSNLVTDYEHDARGRVTQTLGPVHEALVGGSPAQVRTASWTLYKDADRETVSAAGYRRVSDGSDVLINPVSITKRDRNGNVLEEIRAVRASTAGRPVAGDVHTQSDYVAWTTHAYADCCKLAATRVYRTIPATGEGAAGTHYDETTYGYDALRRRNRTVAPGGRIDFEVFDARGLTVASLVGTDDAGATEADPAGGGDDPANDMVLLTEHQYDGGVDGGDGNLTRVTEYVDDSTARVTEYGYDWRNRQVAVDGELDFYQATFYDNLDRTIQTERRLGDAAGRLLARDETRYDDRGRVFKRIEHDVDYATGSVNGSIDHEQWYDAAGNVIKQAPAGPAEFLDYAYDALGRRVATTDPLGATTATAYDDAGNAVSATDRVDETSTRAYDPLGRLAAATDPLGNATLHGYDDAGRQTSVTDPRGHAATTAYDAAGRRVAVTDPLSNATTFEYDADGHQTVVTDPLGHVTTREYDYRDRLASTTDSAGAVTRRAYNRVGEVVSETDAKGQSTTHGYDALGRRTSTTDRLNHTTTFAYDALDRLASLTDAEGGVTAYAFDGFGRPASTTWPDHVSGSAPGDAGYGITTTEHDDLGRLVRSTDQLGDTITHLYDAAGRRIAREYRLAANSPAGTIADQDDFTYDDAGRLLTATKGRYANAIAYAYDAAGRISSESLTTDGQTYTIGRGYDASGNLDELTYPDGTVVDRPHEARGLLSSVSYGGSLVASFGYDDGGRETTRTYGNGLVTTTSYVPNENLVQKIANPAVGDYSYTYDVNKNRLSETIAGPMSGYGYDVGPNGYDAEDRLVNWDRADGNLDQAWDLSPVGDWDQFTENADTQDRTHNAVHELTAIDGTALSYDPKGNPTADHLGRSFVWDADGMLQSCTVAAGASVGQEGTHSYTYDAFRRRVSAVTAGSTERVTFVSLASGSVGLSAPKSGPQIAEYRIGVEKRHLNRVQARHADDTLLTHEESVFSYAHANVRLSCVAASNSAGGIESQLAYDAVGRATIGSGSPCGSFTLSAGCPSFTGHAYDGKLGAYYFRLRYYCPHLGLFLSRDTLGYVDGASLYAAFFVLRLAMDPQGGRVLRGELDDLQSGEPTNEEIRAACDSAVNRRKAPGSKYPPGTTWPESVCRDCDAAVSKLKTENDKVKKQLGSLSGKGCNVPIKCVNCDSKNALGGYSSSGNSITICANNADADDIARILEHELVHANQYCHNKNTVRSCRGSLKREIEAYMCSGDCTTVRGCLRRAIASSCKDVDGFCKSGDMISNDTISDILNWFATYKDHLCTFPRPSLPRKSPAGDFPKSYPAE